MRLGTSPVTVRVPYPGARRAGADQRLHLDQHWPVALEHGHHRRTGYPGAPIGQQQPGRIVQGLDALAAHAKHAHPVGGTEAVLHHPQQPQRAVAVALEVHHGVDGVLQHPRPGQAAVLGDMADQHDGGTAAPGDRHQGVGGLTHLGDRAGHAADPVVIERVDRVDDHQRRGGLGQPSQHHLQPGLGQHVQLVADGVQALGASLELIGRLLGGDVEHAAATPGHARRGLQQQRALAHPRLTPDQADRCPGEAAAQRSVQLAYAGCELWVPQLGNVTDRPHRARHVRDRVVVGRSRQLLGEGIPVAAPAAATGPLGGLLPTGQAAEDGCG